jgi:predicted enzyme related to lactoylglutathione lyase
VTAPVPAPPFVRVVDVFCFVTDLAAATDWYRARLGRGPVRVARQLARFDLGGARLTMHTIDEFDDGGPGGCVAYWDVTDVDAVTADWVRHGAVAHRGPKTIMTGERLCQLLDPFGNLIGLRQAAATEGT